MDRKVLNLLLSNVRTPDEREGDLSAQVMANMTGVRRTLQTVEKYGLEAAESYAGALMDYAERMTRDRIRNIPDGTYVFEDRLEDDGVGCENIRIHVSLGIHGDEATLDFTRSSSQVRGSVNAVYAISLSAVLYVFRSLLEGDIPTNAGCLRPIRVVSRKGTVVDARFPAAVAGGNVETSQRIVDVVLGALAAALPGEIPAAGQGTMNNLAIGGVDPRRGSPFSYYETIAGGTGATAFTHGESGVHSHMTNTLNTPVEALEYGYPLRVKEYSIRRGTGGRGRHDGGDGLVREIQILGDAELTVLSERRRIGPYGLFGGEPGSTGRNILIRKGRRREMPGKFRASLEEGDTLRIETPGGGGYGRRSEKG
jgi:N-methylhydantoinase B